MLPIRCHQLPCRNMQVMAEARICGGSGAKPSDDWLHGQRQRWEKRCRWPIGTSTIFWDWRAARRGPGRIPILRSLLLVSSPAALEPEEREAVDRDEDKRDDCPALGRNGVAEGKHGNAGQVKWLQDAELRARFRVHNSDDVANRPLRILA